MGTDWSCELDGKPFTAVELSSVVLATLRKDAQAVLGVPIKRAVITVPAYFHERQRLATIRAGELAGLKVERILNEPTAAAIAYGLHEADEEKISLVFDLGGGTFDVSIVDRFENTLEVRASSGDTFLGGEDFTSVLAAKVLAQRGMVFETAELKMPLAVSRLRWECERAKRELTAQPQAMIRVPDKKGQLTDETCTVTRADFAQWTQQLVSRTDHSIRRALGDAKLTRDAISEVILVGGATRMPCVREHVESLFGKAPACRMNPDEVVALGAAIQAGLITDSQSVKDLVVTDVAPFTLGVEIARLVGGRRKTGYYLPVITRNTTIPVSRVERVGTVEANQTSIQVKLYQGESRKVEGNLLLGEFSVDGIPKGPPGQEIDIRFTYDLNGVLEVEATVVATGRKVQQIVTRYAGNLDRAALKEAVRKLQTLKTHPRDEAPNRFLLRRAERLYSEVPREHREILDALISGFEAALEEQDKAAIEANREALERFVTAIAGDGEDDANAADPF
jgi:molecular chaperone HscC